VRINTVDKEGEGCMRAWELHDHMQSIGKWVDWGNTVDQFLFGDEDSEVSGIAVSWMPTFANLEKALTAKCNLFVTHEPLFAVKVDGGGRIVGGTPFVDDHLKRQRGRTIEKSDAWTRKTEWLERAGMTVYRCHDVWDDFPEVGIHGAWAKWLGFEGEPAASKMFYEVHDVGATTVDELARRILERVKLLGQDVVHVVGDKDRQISKVAVGTGAITSYREMLSLGADVLILTDDGTEIWESGQWSRDSGIPIIIVNHATAEEPGMRTLAKYIQRQFPEVPVVHVPTGCLYRTIK